ncbi:TspB protein [Nitrosomonas eutropha]|uniref:TspB protein n=1 Tax=Nitrosomonas eutropha TaxID=916 RepID=A0A1I7JE28_9PROT|nr:TspB protein [Nitrosomonas eutropha]
MLLPFLFFLSFSASAASTAPYLYVSSFEGSSPSVFTDLQSACDAHVPPDYSFVDARPNYGTVGSTNVGDYYVAANYDTGSLARCSYSNAGGFFIYRNFFYGPTCSGSFPTTQGGVKVCASCPDGFVDQGGVCTNAPPDCPALGTSVGHTLITGDITGTASIAGTGVCISNPSGGGSPGAVCGVQCSSGAVSVDPVTGVSQMYCQAASFTGGTCSPSSVAAADPGPDPDFGVDKGPEGGCPSGTVPGQINDLDVCLPSGSTVQTDVRKTTQGNKTLTTTKNQTVNPDGSVTTTITNIFNDGTSETVSNTVTNDGKINAGNDSGNNNGGKDGSEDMPIPDMDTSLGGFEALPTRVPDNPVFSTSIIATSASCPPPIAFTVMDIDLSIDFEPVCDLAPMIRAIMLILAGVVALRVVVSK